MNAIVANHLGLAWILLVFLAIPGSLLVYGILLVFCSSPRFLCSSYFSRIVQAIAKLIAIQIPVNYCIISLYRQSLSAAVSNVTHKASHLHQTSRAGIDKNNPPITLAINLRIIQQHDRQQKY